MLSCWIAKLEECFKCDFYDAENRSHMIVKLASENPRSCINKVMECVSKSEFTVTLEDDIFQIVEVDGDTAKVYYFDNKIALVTVFLSEKMTTLKNSDHFYTAPLGPHSAYYMAYLYYGILAGSFINRELSEMYGHIDFDEDFMKTVRSYFNKYIR